MNFTTATYRQNRQIVLLVEKLSKETGVEKSIILHFLLTDLQRIYDNKIHVHSATLKTIENEFKELNLKEQNLVKKIERKAIEVNSFQNQITALKVCLEDKMILYSESQNQLNELQKKLEELNSNLTELENEKKQIQYKVMMKSHSLKEMSDFSLKKLGWLLTAFTIIAVLIAIILIIKK